MNKRWPSLYFAIVFLLLYSQALAQGREGDHVYHFDPALSLESPRQAATPSEPQKTVVIEKGEKDANLRLQTDIPVSPYLGAERGPELSPEEERLLSEGTDHKDLPNYTLEAGIGLFVEDRTSLNLGYRFNNPPSLLNDRRNDPLSLSGDLRITFDVKVPF